MFVKRRTDPYFISFRILCFLFTMRILASIEIYGIVLFDLNSDTRYPCSLASNRFQNFSLGQDLVGPKPTWECNNFTAPTKTSNRYAFVASSHEIEIICVREFGSAHTC